MDEEKKEKKEKEKKRRKEEGKQKLFKAKEVENSRVVNSETKVSQRFDFIVPFFGSYLPSLFRRSLLWLFLFCHFGIYHSFHVLGQRP